MMDEREHQEVCPEVIDEPEDDLADNHPWPPSPEEIEPEYPEAMAEQDDFADDEPDLVEPEASKPLAVVPSVVDTERQVQPLAAEFFPVDALPGTIRKFVEEAAKSLSVPPDLIALPTLVSASAAIGNACRSQVKEGCGVSNN